MGLMRIHIWIPIILYTCHNVVIKKTGTRYLDIGKHYLIEITQVGFFSSFFFVDERGDREKEVFN